MPNINNKKKGGKGAVLDKDKGRELTFKEDMEEYGKVVSLLGARKIQVRLANNIEIFAVIPGRFRKKVWITVDDVVLISYRSFEDKKVDVIHKYNSQEVQNLIQYMEIPDWFGRPSSMLVDMGTVETTDIIFEDVIEFDDI